LGMYNLTLYKICAVECDTVKPLCYILHVKV
jgi:hypothetical protein